MMTKPPHTVHYMAIKVANKYQGKKLKWKLEKKLVKQRMMQ